MFLLLEGEVTTLLEGLLDWKARGDTGSELERGDLGQKAIQFLRARDR